MESTATPIQAETLEPAGPRLSAGKRGIRRAILIFVLMMAALTLLSRTLLNYSLPQAGVIKAGPGVLSHDVSGSGLIAAAEIADHVADSRWVVDEVLVEAGDTVRAGQPLLTFRTAEAKVTLLDEQARYRMKQLALDKLMDNYVDAEKAGTEKQSRDLTRDIESARLDLQIQERKIAQMQEQLAGGSTLTAKVDGLVLEVNATAGLALTGGKPAVRVTNLGAGFEFTMNVTDEKAAYLTVGETMEVLLPSLNNARIKGKLTEVNDRTAPGSGSAGTGTSAGTGGTTAEGKVLVVALADSRLKGGEAGELLYSKRMPSSRMVLPNTAVREDDQGSYVYVLKERKGALGTEYYAQRANVTLSDADDSQSAIETGITPLDQIIVSTSKPLGDGERVILASE